MTYRKIWHLVCLLRCTSCGVYRLRVRRSRASAACYRHDDECAVQQAERVDQHSELARVRDEERLVAELRELVDAELAVTLRRSASARATAAEAGLAGGWDTSAIEHVREEGRIEAHTVDCAGCKLLAKTVRWSA